MLAAAQLLIWSLGLLWGALINVALLGAGAVAAGSTKRGGKFGTWLRNLFRRGSSGSGSGLGIGGGSSSGSKWRWPKLFGGSSKGGGLGLGGSSSPTDKSKKSWWPFGKKSSTSGPGSGGGAGSTGGKNDPWWKRKFRKDSSGGGGGGSSSSGGSPSTSKKPGSTTSGSSTESIVSGLKGLLDCPKCGHHTRDPKCACASWSCLCNTPEPATTPAGNTTPDPKAASDRKPLIKDASLTKDPVKDPLAVPVVNNSTGPTITPQPPAPAGSGAPKAPEPSNPGEQKTEEQQQRNTDMTSSVNPRCVVCDHPKSNPAPNCQCTRTQCTCTQLRAKMTQANERGNVPTQPVGAGRNKAPAGSSTASRTPGDDLDNLKYDDGQSLQRAGKNLDQIAPAAAAVAKRFARAEELEAEAAAARKIAEEGAERVRDHLAKAAEQMLNDMPAADRLKVEAEGVRMQAKHADGSEGWQKVASNASTLPMTYKREHETDEDRLNEVRASRARERRADVTTASADN